MFNMSAKQKDYTPLAERMRPQDLDSFTGQTHLLGEGKPLKKLIENDSLGSIVLWGPPGIGKTTLARIIANKTKKTFQEISAVNAGVADLRKIIKAAKESLLNYNKQTILFIDEVHRFNKAQQDAVLPFVEDGTLSLIGSTTENPSFSVIPALRSRCKTFQLRFLSFDEIKYIVLKSLKSGAGYLKISVKISDESVERIVLQANGDARFALNALEAVISSSKKDDNGNINVSDNEVSGILEKGLISYDRAGDEHFNHASAFQKSLRGSDPDAAVYWLAKMIAGGEDPKFIARRLLVTAAEDVGNANPLAILVANAAFDSIDRLGMPEARIALSQAVTYIATSPKSNSSISAIDTALSDIERKGKSFPVPDHLKDTHYADSGKYGFGKGYKYPHSYPGNYVLQEYLPPELKDKIYYVPTDNGEEVRIKQRMKKK